MTINQATAFVRISAVTRIANDLYDERDEDTGRHRKLETFEALFISAVQSINRSASKIMSDALKTWGGGQVFDAICNLTYRQQADDLESALASYDNERHRFLGDYDDSLEEVAHQMAAE